MLFAWDSCVLPWVDTFVVAIIGILQGIWGLELGMVVNGAEALGPFVELWSIWAGGVLGPDHSVG